MLDATTMTSLSTHLSALKGSGRDFGGINVVFLGDFFQLPTVAGSDLWKNIREEDKAKLTGSQLKNYEQIARGHDLWRSVNAVVCLEQQMRQSEDEELVEILRALRNRRIENRHVARLRSRIMKSHEDLDDCEVILVRRNNLRSVLNDWKVHRIAQLRAEKMFYSCAQILERGGHAQKEILSARAQKDLLGDCVLALIPGAPLMITENIDVAKGCEIGFEELIVGLVNGAIVEFYGIGPCKVIDYGTCYVAEAPADYLLVRVKDRVNPIRITGLPQDVFDLKATTSSGRIGRRKAFRIKQFPVTLAYAISDFKSQGLFISSCQF
jgi:hypothetical protein